MVTDIQMTEDGLIMGDCQQKNLRINSHMRKFQQYITEGVYDPSIFKAFFLAGGPGSGKSWVSKKALSGMVMKLLIVIMLLFLN